MMYGMMGGMIWGSLLAVLMLLGFAYIIWVLAAKEKGNVKTVGQIIAIIIAVLAAVILLYGTIYGGMMGRGAWCGYGRGYKMFGPRMMRKMMDMPEGERREYMEKRMEKYMEKHEK